MPLNMKEGDLIFCYGSLRLGEANDLSKRGGSNVEYCGTAKVNGYLYDVSWFPGLQLVDDNLPDGFSDDAPAVIGDVFRVTAASEILQDWLDMYEGHPDLFFRTRTITDGGHVVWIYTYPHEVPESSRVLSGDWSKRNDATEEG